MNVVLSFLTQLFFNLLRFVQKFSITQIDLLRFRVKNSNIIQHYKFQDVNIPPYTRFMIGSPHLN